MRFRMRSAARLAPVRRACFVRVEVVVRPSRLLLVLKAEQFVSLLSVFGVFVFDFASAAVVLVWLSSIFSSRVVLLYIMHDRFTERQLFYMLIGASF